MRDEHVQKWHKNMAALDLDLNPNLILILNLNLAPVGLVAAICG